MTQSSNNMYKKINDTTFSETKTIETNIDSVLSRKDYLQKQIDRLQIEIDKIDVQIGEVSQLGIITNNIII